MGCWGRDLDRRSRMWQDWRKLHSGELHDLYSLPDIFGW